MLRQSIQGFENVMEWEEPENSVIMVEGPTGSLKSSFVFTALMNYTKKTDTKALYITLEESKERHLLNLKAMGFEESKRVKVIDYDYSRKLARITGEIEGELKWIINSVREYNKERGGISCLVIDSLNALYTLAGALKNRIEIYLFFDELRRMNTTTFIIGEVSEPNKRGIDGSLMGTELFLCDGLIDLGTVDVDNKVMRYVQIKKMRGVKHSLDKYSLDVEKARGVVALEELIV
ncbi:MAG: ATPase domain-containing protein [Candidatus Altiarchaeota archaeon]|nr:ATPase domain-containing protein [Candidatus Altiarchaeota archaeon]